MPKPIAVANGTCFAFPDILQTPISSGGTAPMPYPNIAQLADATKTARSVNAGREAVIVEDSKIDRSSGGEAGTGTPARNGRCNFTSFSGTVTANGKKIVRQLDQTSQNSGNAVGMVMSGLSTVLVGG